MTGHQVKPIILDACCLLNLYASGKLEQIIETLPEPFVVAEYVAKEETLYIRRKIPDQDIEEKEPVNIEPLISRGFIQSIKMNNEKEQETFVDLATELDDGEAITISLAIHRQYTVATDDLKALKVMSGISNLHDTSTLELVKRWSELANAKIDEIKAILSNMWSAASYYPGGKDPLYKWWLEIISGK